jgi:hypothetical protein
MPLYKFKTFDEARRALWNSNPDAEYYARLRRFYAIADSLHVRKIKRGIQCYKTIEEAQEDLRRSRLKHRSEENSL